MSLADIWFALFIVIVAGIIAKFGFSGLLIATLMAGILLVLMGVTGLGRAIQFIPRPVTIGFTNGIALIIALPQIKDFLGLTTLTVTATDPFGTAVTDSDPSHYTGTAPGIDIEKFTNGVDADDPPGPILAAGAVPATVAWTYVVRNTGNVAITGLTVTDDQGVPVTCPAPAPNLPVGATITCTGPPGQTARPGQYARPR